MKWSWKLGRFAGIDTYVHATFLLLVAWAAWASWSGAGTALAVLMGVGFLLAVFASVLLHELGHALTARRHGVATRSIILSPIGGIAQLEGMPRRPRAELEVALAGPAVNFVLAAVLWLVVPVFAGAPLLADLLGSVMLANLGLGLFNLVPAFPMDGGRALRAILAERMSSRRATETAVKIGRGVALAMGAVGLLWGPTMLVLIAAFVWFAAGAELRASRASAYLDDVEVLGAPPAYYGRSRGGSAYGRARGRGRFWGDLLDPRPTHEHPPRAPRGGFWSRSRSHDTAHPVRVVIVRRGWWS